MLTIRRPATYFLALLLAPLVLLSGCGEFNAGFVIRDEDHIDVTVAFGVLKSSFGRDGSGQSEGFAKRLRGCSELTPPNASLTGKAKVKPFDDGTYVGCTVTGTMTATDITVQSGWPRSVANPPADVFRGHKENGPIGITFDDEIIRFHLDR